MTLEEQVTLSYYTKLTDINKEHNVTLVQHSETDKIYVQKILHTYDLNVFYQLKAHPVKGTPAIIELIESEDTLYLIEEYISGTTLRDILTQRHILSEAESCDLFLQLCNILKQLHQFSPPIIHRDIKPENIIVTPDQSLYLLDFNAAKERRENQSQDTVLIGTAGYAAPEQYGFSASTTAVDIYALGVVLHEMLTGLLPNQTSYTGKYSEIIKKCTEMDAKNRYADVNQLIAAFKHNMESKNTSLDNHPIHFSGNLRDWLPPGFRSRNILLMLFAATVYLFMTCVCFSFEVQNVFGFKLTLYRIFTAFLLLTETFWLGNYRHIWNRFPLSREKHLLRKIFGVALWGSLYFFWSMFLFVIIVGFI